jgi:hypothetical protein
LKDDHELAKTKLLVFEENGIGASRGGLNLHNDLYELNSTRNDDMEERL